MKVLDPTNHRVAAPQVQGMFTTGHCPPDFTESSEAMTLIYIVPKFYSFIKENHQGFTSSLR